MKPVGDGDIKIPLFPYFTRFIGVALVVLGLISAYLYFFAGKPSFFNSKVFAVVTAYLKTRYFVLIKTNLLDEIAAVFVVTGLALVAFSKEKFERPEYNMIRLKALILSVYCTVILWIAIFLLVYGYLIFVAAMMVFILFIVIYIILFHYFKKRTGVNSRTENY